jgi:hypothetical protein
LAKAALNFQPKGKRGEGGARKNGRTGREDKI